MTVMMMSIYIFSEVHTGKSNIQYEVKAAAVTRDENISVLSDALIGFISTVR